VGVLPRVLRYVSLSFCGQTRNLELTNQDDGEPAAKKGRKNADKNDAAVDEDNEVVLKQEDRQDSPQKPATPERDEI
jgi:hypothetical protein